jgi:PilZ domain
MWREDANRSPNGDVWSRYTGQERRGSPRIETPFPAAVRSVDIGNQPFKEYVVLDNLSSGGLYLRLARQIQPGTRLFVLIRLSIAPDDDSSTACIALHGVVLRVEPRPGGVFGTAINLAHYRFIYVKYRPERSHAS